MQNKKTKKDQNFKSIDSLQQVVNIVNEASDALDDKKRTIQNSPIPEVLTGVIGAGAGGAGSFALLYSLGTVGLSAPGSRQALLQQAQLSGAAW